MAETFFAGKLAPPAIFPLLRRAYAYGLKSVPAPRTVAELQAAAGLRARPTVRSLDERIRAIERYYVKQYAPDEYGPHNIIPTLEKVFAMGVRDGRERDRVAALKELQEWDTTRRARG